ncbi:MAG TPA: hypothetical protein DCY07_01720 [Rhodospirillaceae bacterium]|nr:hypothetical protein [Rhodospirillaceae bacterium]
MTTRSGSLRVPFLLQSETLIAGDEGGGSVSQWNTVATFFGRFEHYSEKYKATIEFHLTHQITTRYNPMLKFELGQRVVHEDRLFMIRDVRDIYEDKQWIALYIEEVKYVI